MIEENLNEKTMIIEDDKPARQLLEQSFEASALKIEMGLPRGWALRIDLRTKKYEAKKWEAILAEGLGIEPESKAPTTVEQDFREILGVETEAEESEVAIIMRMPDQQEDTLALLKAYNLNPLIELELAHQYTTCHANSFISPSLNKDHNTADVCSTSHEQQHIVTESQFLNIAVRDKDKLEKLRVTKVVHAFLHKKVFIFYQKPQQFQDIS